MKHFILIVLTVLIYTPEAHALFGHTAEERQRRIATEQQLSQEQQRLDAQQHLTVEQAQRANRFQIIASALGVLAIFMLIAGTAIGSRGRQYANAQK